MNQSKTLQAHIEQAADAYRRDHGPLSSPEWAEKALPDAVWAYFAENGGFTGGDRAYLAELGLSETLDFEGNDHDA